MIVIFEKIIAIMIGSFLIGIGINGFLIPHQMIDGGVIGIALILHYYFDYSAGTLMFLISLPLFIYAWFHERPYFYKNFLGLIAATIIIDWLEPLREQFHFPILYSALLGGAFIGVGVGTMLRYKVSTGGTDLLAQFISKSLLINVGVIIFIIDGLIIAFAFNVLGFQSWLFSSLSISVVGLITYLIVRPNNTAE